MTLQQLSQIILSPLTGSLLLVASVYIWNLAWSGREVHSPRLIRWFWTVLFASLPLLIAAICFWLAESFRLERFYNRPEVIFAALVLSGSAWRDLSAPDVPLKDWVLQIFVLGAALLTFVSASVFGLQTWTLTVGNQNAISLERIFNLSRALALVTFVGASILQLIIARGEAVDDDS
jgi:hypothetical protein